ncbi:AAA family ATPase, partial [Kitasatospora sp. MBT63]
MPLEQQFRTYGSIINILGVYFIFWWLERRWLGMETGSSVGTSSGFVGREVELGVLGSCVVGAAAGVPWLVEVEGEAGIGKTSLVRRVVEGLEGWSVWWASCDAAEQDWPYGVVEQWRRQAGRVLLREFAVLGGVLGPSVTPVAVGAELVDLLGAVQDSGPVVLVVDDAQWMDEESLRVLRFVMRRLWADQVLVLATVRTRGPVDEGTLAGERAQEWQRLVAGAPNAQVVRLGGLGEADVGRLLAGAYGAAGGSSAGVAAVRRVWEHTGGHPLYVRSLVAALGSAGLADAQVGLPVPESLAEAVRRTLVGLPQDGRALVEALAVLDARVPLVLAGRVAGVADTSLALGPLLASGLVEWAPSEPSSPVAITHRLQRDAVYRVMRPQRRRELHTAAVPVVDAKAAWAHRVAATDHA